MIRSFPDGRFVNRISLQSIVFNSSHHAQKLSKRFRRCLDHTIRFFLCPDKEVTTDEINFIRSPLQDPSYSLSVLARTNLAFYFRIELSHLFTLQAKSCSIFLIFLEDRWTLCSHASTCTIRNYNFTHVKCFPKQDLFFLPFRFRHLISLSESQR